LGIVSDPFWFVCSFIECTGTDYTKLNIVLNTIVRSASVVLVVAARPFKSHFCAQIAMFSEYCKVPFSVEAVEVVDEATKRTQVQASSSLARRHCCKFPVGRSGLPSTEGGSLRGR
jgi:hypothetical protein